ncbi:unnamed protein product [Peniophora sp. CBMAI 1063]|nr:unnamed protein product [Peniophora sp. CBMAI 1063]
MKNIAPPPHNPGSKGKGKRSAADRGSDDEESAPPPKKFIVATGYDGNKKITLKRRPATKEAGQKTKQGAAVAKSTIPDRSRRGASGSKSQTRALDEAMKALKAAGLDPAMIKAAMKICAEDREDMVTEENDQPQDTVEAGSDAQDGPVEGANPDDLELHASMRGCQVTTTEKMDGPLRGSYAHIPKLSPDRFVHKNMLVNMTTTAMFASEMFSSINQDRLISMLTFKAHAGSGLSNPARDDPKRHKVSPRINKGGAIIPQSSKGDNQPTAFVFYGYTHTSNVMDGRTYTKGNGVTKCVKEYEINMVTMESERAMAFLSAVLGGRQYILPVTEGGGVMFATKHSVVSDNDAGTGEYLFHSPLSSFLITQTLGNALPGHFQATTRKKSQMCHPDIQRRARDANEPVPVWDCTNHFLGEQSNEEFRPVDILTQTGRTDDERWMGDVPAGAFVAVISTVSFYGSDSQSEEKTLSFNLSAIHVLAVPREE